MNVNHLLATSGYGAVFVLVTLESLGILLPGETILIAAGATPAVPTPPVSSRGWPA